ncbi:unnamed protein product [Didymodactylos carnosus]|uniref:HAT C-terminal dimerisation domain-containing protein n=1 Tax=Didymodactylos carnosus TaxID=1234261 RepID=A0A814NYE9_9BILA|nr:unnamed protein product [Didymodactylos carnosus]CAF1099082.1 unnamed protein product [Didymodactylos carnosus]CAF3678245.1 unnamed protein product [Didymodactylos carnosus]CAF3864116.1 unnamed protein product [Didymodactylos carnosus]
MVKSGDDKQSSSVAIVNRNLSPLHRTRSLTRGNLLSTVSLTQAKTQSRSKTEQKAHKIQPAATSVLISASDSVTNEITTVNGQSNNEMEQEEIDHATSDVSTTNNIICVTRKPGRKKLSPVLEFAKRLGRTEFLCLICNKVRLSNFMNLKVYMSMKSAIFSSQKIVTLYELQGKVAAIVTDNCSNIKSATQVGFGVRIYCCCHALNLMIQNSLQLWPKQTTDKKKEEDDDSGLSENDNTSMTEISSDDNEDEVDDDSSMNDSSTDDEQSRKYIRKIQKSSILYNAVKNMAPGQLKVGLIIDMKIRWNSTFKILKRLLLFRESLNEFHQHDLSNSIDSLKLSFDEWRTIETLANILDPMNDASEILAGQQYSSLSAAFGIINASEFFLKTKSYDPFENCVKSSLLKCFRFYFKDQMDKIQYKFMLLAAYLNPNTHLELSNEDKVLAKQLILEEWKTTSPAARATAPLVTTTQQQQQPPASTKMAIFLKKIGRPILSTLTTTNSKMSAPDVTEEIALFQLLPKKDINTSSFWLENTDRLPLLSKFVKKYLAIPASTVASESAFSIANFILRNSRCGFSSKSIKFSMFLRDKV